jgi:hypothetical protein
VTKNSIDCHMPKQQTDLIVFDFKGKRVRPEIRSHLIKNLLNGEPRWAPIFNTGTPAIPSNSRIKRDETAL